MSYTKAVPYHLKDHIYMAQFQEDLILLDTREDKYVVCTEEISRLLLRLIDEGSRAHKEHYLKQNQENLQKLLKGKVIEEKESTYPFFIDRKIDSSGVENVDWRLPLKTKKINFNGQTLRALLTLLKVDFYMKTRGFYSVLKLIKKTHKSHLTYDAPPEENLIELAETINEACFLYPKRTKCLEWAVTFVLLALKRNWRCNLEIGVQNYPFFSHAWVECDGKVVMDAQDLREGLAIVLREPFRKLKT